MVFQSPFSGDWGSQLWAWDVSRRRRRTSWGLLHCAQPCKQVGNTKTKTKTALQTNRWEREKTNTFLQEPSESGGNRFERFSLGSVCCRGGQVITMFYLFLNAANCVWVNIFRFSELFSAAIRENGTLCLSIFRLLEEDIDDDGDLDQVLTVGIWYNPTFQHRKENLQAANHGCCSRKERLCRGWLLAVFFSFFRLARTPCLPELENVTDMTDISV